MAYSRRKSPRKRSRKSISRRRSTKNPRKSTRKVRISISKPGSLSKYGYSMSKTAASRHKALSKAVKAYGYGSIMRKVNAIYVFNKKKHPDLARKASRDKSWLREKYF